MNCNISVVIPTHNRMAVLTRCLEALTLQTTLPDLFDVVLVDDGSKDGTEEVVSKWQKSSNIRINYFYQQARGPASARNLGVREASRSIVLFLGDDILPATNLLEEHIKVHELHPDDSVAVLGFVTWSPEIKVTHFMRWLENGGPQFGYRTIQDPANVPWTFLYTANISFKRDFLLKNGLFDEDFPYAAYEDIELGHRLAQKGMRIVYNPKAIGHHFHPTGLRQALGRMEKVGYSYGLYRSKIGQGLDSRIGCDNGIRGIIGELKFWLYQRMGFFLERRVVVPAIYAYLMDKARSKGLKQYVKLAGHCVGSPS